jgi:hypothetical protein
VEIVGAIVQESLAAWHYNNTTALPLVKGIINSTTSTSLKKSPSLSKKKSTKKIYTSKF